MPHLLNVWPNVSKRLAGAGRILLLLDYDGTLTPIVARPADAVLADDARELLSGLVADERYLVGIVTGRSLADLATLVDVPGLICAGNHGLEITGPGLDFLHPEVQASGHALDEAARLLSVALAQVPGLTVEHKGLTLTVHFRGTPDSFDAEVDATVVATVAPYVQDGQVKVTRGKKVVEVRPNVDWGKGQAILKIREAFPDSPYPVFIGDDQTDEEGFLVVQEAGGLAVYVGPPREQTVALHRLESTAEVHQLLALLLEL
ncbi:MAG: trehalose-phosphatase [SAR202 cluster bacterium Io17-Chloro-G9]|nr:MAG: trehalose-phosphatase [SAR202 cluster bacterium Io17-Chloro-G9]